MKRWIFAIAIGAASLSEVAAAEENFSKAIRTEDFSAAGLEKLSPSEIARLDALVRDFKSGALEKARREAAAAEARAAKAEADAKVAIVQAEKKNETSLLARAKVLLTPGTQIEYSTVESRLVGEFTGWDGRRTIFKLENGQRWQVVDANASYYGPPIAAPAVKIVPGALGTFWLTVEGVKSRVKVVSVDGAK